MGELYFFNVALSTATIVVMPDGITMSESDPRIATGKYNFIF